MLLWAVFTLGYFAGVFTALAIFPPWVKEIEEQEEDAAAPLETEAIISKPAAISEVR